jgi:hypothetical protein
MNYLIIDLTTLIKNNNRSVKKQILLSFNHIHACKIRLLAEKAGCTDLPSVLLRYS